MTPKKIISLIMGGVLVLSLLMTSSQMFEVLEADQVMVIQAPFSGKLTWYTTPGTKWQGFGTVTKYPKREQLWFSAKGDQGP